ncbi:MAG TPA: hypothetical protein ENN64_00620, partial [bacterium]|nr:hypothetical protein [bacterium]
MNRDYRKNLRRRIYRRKAFLRQYIGHKESSNRSEWVFLGERDETDVPEGRFKKSSEKILNLCSLFFLLMILFQLIIHGRDTVLADDFYPSGDSVNCKFAQAESITISKLPEKDDFLYDDSNVYGTYESGFPSRNSISAVASISFPGAGRIKGKHDFLRVPPRSRVEVGHYIYNYSGHTVKLQNLYLFLNQQNGNGDWRRLGAEGGSYKSVQMIVRGEIVEKKGFVIKHSNYGSWKNSDPSNLPKGRTIYSFDIVQPLQIETIRQELSYTLEG